MSDNIKRDKEKVQQIQVFVRVRPLSKHERETHSYNCIEVINSREVLIKQHRGKRYCFDGVFNPTVKQLTVYETIVKPLISEVLAGYNCTVFAYGQTGTGKTYTMAGGSACCSNASWQDDEEAGIIPRAFAHLFDELRLIQQEHTVRVSYLELYNEELYDLLADGDDSNRIRIYEDQRQKGSVIIQGIEEQTVHNKYEIYKILEKGEEKRKTAATLMNDHSTRSHTVFCITIHTRETTVEGEELVKTGKLNLVDLAGSENVSRSGAVDRRAREAGNINQSLLNLGRVIKALVEKTAHIPYRASKLTRILQDSLGGRTKTSIIATISPSTNCLDETLSTLDYANRARYIINRPEVNHRMSQKQLMTQYVEEIERLRKDLSATRTGNGVYLANENFVRLVNDQQMCSEELAEKVVIIRDLEQQIKSLKEQKTTIEEQQNRLQYAFEETNKELNCCQITLQQMTVEKEEQECLTSYYSKTAKVLHEQAQTLLNVTSSLIGNETTLHEKIENLYSSATANNNTMKHVGSTVLYLCCNMIEELTEFMGRFYNRNNRLVNMVQYLQNKQKETYTLTTSVMNNLNENIKIITENIVNKIQIQQVGTDICVNNILDHCNSYVEILNNMQESNDSKLSHYLEQLLKTEKQQHEEFYKKVEEKLENIFSAIHGLSQNITQNFDSFKDEILVEVDKLIKSLNTKCKATDDTMTQTVKWRYELHQAVDQSFDNIFKKMDSCNSTDKFNLEQMWAVKENIQSKIPVFYEKLQTNIGSTVNAVNAAKAVTDENFQQIPILLLWDKIINDFNTKKQLEGQATAKQLQQLSKDTKLHVNNFKEANLDALFYVKSILKNKCNDLLTFTQQQASVNGESLSEFKNKSNEVLKELSDCNIDTTEHKMSLSSKLYNCQECVTKFINNNIVQIRHPGDIPTRFQHTSRVTLKQLKPKDLILVKYHQQQAQNRKSLNLKQELGSTEKLPDNFLYDENDQENTLGLDRSSIPFKTVEKRASATYNDNTSVLQ